MLQQNWFGYVLNASGMVACSDQTDHSTDTELAADRNHEISADSTSTDITVFSKQTYIAPDGPATNLRPPYTRRFQ